jgi:hypothetical protein
VVNAMGKAHKHFNLLDIPSRNCSVNNFADEHHRDDCSVHILLCVEPPDYNKVFMR